MKIYVDDNMVGTVSNCRCSGLSPFQLSTQWKHATVILLYKDGKCDEASTYRQIAVLPIISKIMERIVHDQLYKFSEENNILNKWQSGFRPFYSTETDVT